MRYEVRCYSAPYENTSLLSYDDAVDLCYNLSEEYGLTEVFTWVGPYQNLIASYEWGL